MAKQFEYAKIDILRTDKDYNYNKSIMEKLNQAGKEGWELVSTYSPDGHNSSRSVYGILKREITPELQQEQKQTQ